MILFTPVFAEAQPDTTVVVLPFANLSQEATDDWIGAGIVETVSSDLQNDGLTVVGRGSVERHSRQAYHVAGVDWLVDGGFQRVGDRLRVTARVVDVATGTVTFRTKVDGTFAELFGLQDDIGAAVARWLVPASTGLSSPIPGTPSLPTSAASTTAAETSDDVTGTLVLGGTSDSRRGGGGFAAVPVSGRPTAVIMRTDDPPQIDGRLDDSVWETATHITEFVQIAPVEGAPGSEETEVWMTYDSEHLYVAFYAHYADPAIMRVNRAEREDIRGDDRMAVLFEPFNDQQRAYQLEVNGYGVQADSLVNADGSRGFSRGSSSSARRGSSGTRRRSSSGLSSSGQFGIRGDESWDALFDTGGQILEDGWSAEMRIPFKSLRYPSRQQGEGHRWGFQIVRIIRGKSEAQLWSPVSRGVAGQLTQFGQLEGMSDLSRSRNLEILPEVTGVRLGSLDAENGIFDEGDPTGEIGVGIKYGITPNLTADVTFNPDFSQIESDQPRLPPTNGLRCSFQSSGRSFSKDKRSFRRPRPSRSCTHGRSSIRASAAS